MTEWEQRTWDNLHALFSVVLLMDESMQVVHASETALKFMPELGGNPTLNDAFDILRPTSLKSFAEAHACLNSLCLLTAKNRKFAIRGQLISIGLEGRSLICLAGAPWLFWINSHCPDAKLSLSDFSTQDVQLDQLFFMSTEKRMVEDLEQLNIDLQKTKAELEREQLAQTIFFAQMSHEMRTPLNGVVNAIALLEPLELDEQQEQLLAMAKSSSNNLMQVINYVLDVAKIEQLREDEKNRFQGNEFLKSILDIVKPKARVKSLEVRLDMTAEFSQSFLTYTGQLRQILLNLLTNAIKFTDSGLVCLRIRQLHQQDDQCIFRFEIIDTGIGIALDKQAEIFRPFFSLPPKHGSALEHSTGLGLDIVTRSVALLNGTTGVTSQPGEGSTFWFEIPLTLIPGSVTEAPADTSAKKRALERRLSGRILLVDDNQTNLLLESMILESMGLEVLKASDGAEAVAKASRDRPDLVLMDINMPDISGLEATRQIREFADAQSLPVLALTAYADSREKAACLAAGMNAYLNKPILREDLAAELAKWLISDNLHDGSLLDKAVLQDLTRQIGEDNLRIVVDKIQAEATQRWEELQHADRNADRPSVQRHVHSLGSIFRSVGLTTAGDDLTAIESILRSGDELPEDWIEALESPVKNSLSALARYMAAL
jgi:signal transduction histidine kinase/DNA-binding response OmpR family regulator